MEQRERMRRMDGDKLERNGVEYEKGRRNKSNEWIFGKRENENEIQLARALNIDKKCINHKSG